MKLIPLPKNKFAKVDDDMFDFLNQWRWTFDGKYAVRHIGGRKNHQKIYLHRIVACTPANRVTDHINGDRLDNRKENLRRNDISASDQL